MSFEKLKIVQEKLSELFNAHQVDAGHGLDHALAVMNLGYQGILSSECILNEDKCLAILLACLLHDADDSKFFSSENSEKKYPNAEKILNETYPKLTFLTCELISYVSCSQNGNSVKGLNLPQDEWKLYPRYADRCEALGEIGIFRCWIYTQHVNRPYFTESTPRVTSIEELERVASEERFQRYLDLKGKVGESSMMDHYYDKLFRLIVHPSNKFFRKEFEKRGQPIIDFILKFGRTGQVDEDYLKELSKKFSNHS